MTLFSSSRVRRFGISSTSGKIVYQAKTNGPVKELCEVPGHITYREIQERSESLHGREFKTLSGRRYDSDVIARTPEGAKVTTIQVENVYNDWLLINSICGLGTYEHIANAHELSVLQIARKMFGS